MTRTSIVGSARMLLSSLTTSRKMLPRWSRNVSGRDFADCGTGSGRGAVMSRLLLSQQQKGKNKVRHRDDGDRGDVLPEFRHAERLREHADADRLVPGGRKCQPENPGPAR